MIGKTYSHYHILEELGRGGMGTVYKAEDTKLDRMVALKFLPSHLSQADEEKKRFIHEAKAASALDHPNICTIYEINETDDGQMFIAMACYEGQSLKEKIDRGPIPLDEAVDIAIQIAEGLEKAHKKKIVHRDIKPANILLTEDGTVKIVDFGLAKLADRSLMTKEGTTLGTAAYMSPEQTRGDAVDQRADIWALGVILYEMLTGERPFKGDYEQAVIYSILNEEPESVENMREDLPKGLSNVISNALLKDPNRRYRSMGDFIADLKMVGSKHPQSGFGIGKSFERQFPKPIALGFLALIVTSIIVFLIVRPFRKEPARLTSLIVLPFENLTGNNEFEYFVSGMHASLIGEISKISALRVISKTTSNTYKNADKPISDIATELDIDAAIEASVLSLGDSVLIQVKLIGDFPDEKQLWLQDYVEDKSQILNLYTRVTKEISKEINVVLTPQEEHLLATSRTVNPEAYDAYMKGKYIGEKFGKEDLFKAIDYMHIAIEKDPDWGKPYIGLSNAWGVLMQMAFVQPTIALPKVYEYLNKARELDADDADSYYSRGTMSVWIEWNWEKGERDFLKTLEINPNDAMARIFYSHLLYILNRYEEGRIQADIALKLDPKKPLLLGLVAQTRIYEGDYQAALDLAKRALSIDPDQYIAKQLLQTAYFFMEDMDNWFEGWKQVAWWDEDVLAVIDSIYYSQGYLAATEEIIRVNEKAVEKGHISMWGQANRYCRVKKYDKAMDCLEKAYDIHDPNMPYLPFFGVDFPDLKKNLRFVALMKKMKLPIQ